MTLGVTLAMLRGLHEGANDGGVGIDLVRVWVRVRVLGS
jgi:hypothetical protein